MALVFAAVTPHPPLLIPTIGKDQMNYVEKTKQAMLQLEQELYVAKPNVILIITPHGSLYPDSFVLNAHTSFHSSFEQFGDLTTKCTWRGAPELAADISHEAKKSNLPVQLISQQSLDHGAAVALFYLTAHMPEVKVLPVGYSGLSREAHIQFGEMLKDAIMQSDKRIAVIASGDLAHCLSKDAPAGLKKEGELFDNGLIKLLEQKKVDEILGMDEKIIAEVQECGYRSVLITLGILKNMDFSFKTLSYEYPFGIGYLVGHFML